MIRILSVVLMLALSSFAMAENIGSVSTNFRMLGSNDEIKVDAFDDPDVKGVSCFISYAKTGGIKGDIGLASDTSDASVACRQTGPISFDPNIKEKDEVFNKKSSLFFKKLHVVRFVDKSRKTMIYLTFSDHLVNGSPKNAISAVYYGQ